MNDRALNNNYRANITQSRSALGNVTLLDRVDLSLEQKRDRSMLQAALPQPGEQAMTWMCSLRQNDVDLEHDTFLEMKKTEQELVEDRVRRDEEMKNSLMEESLQ